jgi:hypothetical protein
MAYINCPQCKNKTNDLLTYCKCGYQLNKLNDKSEYTEKDIENKSNNISYVAYCFRGIANNLIFLVVIHLLTAFIVRFHDTTDLNDIEFLSDIYIINSIISVFGIGVIISYFFRASKSMLKIKID